MIRNNSTVEVSEVGENKLPLFGTCTNDRMISFGTKLFEYEAQKTILIPFNGEETNNGKFNCIGDAMQAIYDHCIKYHGSFKRNLAHKYAENLQVLDIVRNAYVPLTSIAQRDFNKAFTMVSKRMINKI